MDCHVRYSLSFGCVWQNQWMLTVENVSVLLDRKQFASLEFKPIVATMMTAFAQYIASACAPARRMVQSKEDIFCILYKL